MKSTSDSNYIFDLIFFILIFKIHSSDVLHFIKNEFLWTKFFNILRILKHYFNDLVVIVHSFFG